MFSFPSQEAKSGLDGLNLAAADGALDPSFGSATVNRVSNVRVLVPDGDQVFVGGGYYDRPTSVSRATFIDAATGAVR